MSTPIAGAQPTERPQTPPDSPQSRQASQDLAGHRVSDSDRSNVLNR